MKTYLCLELKKQKKVSPLGRSCFFGDPDFYKMDNSYQDDDFFVCQINLSDIREKINSVYLPPKGLLYFFISLKDMKGKVIYRDFDNADNLERIAFNEGFSFHQKEYKINFTSHHHHKDFMMLYENERLSGIKVDEVVLLKLNFKHFLNNNKKFFLYYVITKDDLMKRVYDNVRTLIVYR